MPAVTALSAVVALVFAAPARAAPRGAQRGGHPDVGGDQSCRACHATATPQAFDAWARSKHGLDLVTCVVCHGSTGADFRRRPASDRCEGCHPARTASRAAPIMKGGDCFACHPGHGLDPHATSREQATAALVNADVELKRELELGPVNGPNAAADAPARDEPAAPPPAPAKDLGTSQPHPPTEKR